MAWESKVPQIKQRHSLAQRQGLLAAANVVRNTLIRALRGGYTSGAFVTGTSINAITISDPMRSAGGWEVAVGTNLLYPLFWELGHMNIYLRRYVRVERWRPAALDSREEAAQAFGRVYTRVMEGGV